MCTVCSGFLPGISRELCMFSESREKSGKSVIFLRELKLKARATNADTRSRMFLDALLTIRLTSKQNERNVSTSGIFVTKRRSRRSDRATNALCVLRFRLKNDNFLLLMFHIIKCLHQVEIIFTYYGIITLSEYIGS
jgi:hypothetical protein